MIKRFIGVMLVALTLCAAIYFVIAVKMLCDPDAMKLF